MSDPDTNLRQRLLGYWHWLLEGDAQSPEQRMHLGFLFCAALSCFVGAVLNYLVGFTDAFIIGVLAVVGLCLLAGWAYLRRGYQASRSIMMICCVIAILILPLNWIYNQGLYGPSLMLFLTVAGYAFCVLLVAPIQRLILAVLFLVVPYLLIWLDYRAPGWIEPYPSRGAHALDAAVSYTICIGLMLAMVSGFFRRFRSEQRIIQDYAERLREAGRRDSLTGLFNHGAFYALVNDHCRTAANDGDAALILYDLDHFKRVNDLYGHVYGDRTLQFFARTLRDVVDARGGVAGRCGGEEFAVFLSQGTRLDVEELDALVRAACEQAPLEHGAVQFSGGVSFEAADSVEVWMERADNALYVAKCRGRGRTVFRACDAVRDECWARDATG